uniref:DNA mismatch repair protein MutL n=1 Tax=uncultured Candidatus Melainabacteria bacterium TaxID=2682970 RepID=A0A650EKQ7_9BACT|nr:DNA mismatch repair protein MutL [uncultured Candidatus Melainabacteria bacterium]
MARIRQLSKHLINQIAAGEVIERPASVVKELTENSIDAGAKKVSIEINNECRDIRVADNGCGIHPDDIMLAFSKHATSKLLQDEDLFDIHTLGFRGEALASIISISKLTCTTRTKDFETGTKVKCENSEVNQVETGCAIGTIMDIKDLFYNVPVRLKFLKNANTEFSYIQEIVQSIALSHPEVSIELKKFGKTVLKTTGQGNLTQTIKEVYSTDVTNNLKEVLKTDELSGLKISGFVSTPDYTRSSKKSYHIYINSRSVKCPIFQKAIDTVYKNLTANNKYPFVVLNLEIPPHDVDVNVHPTKKEVRYKNTNQIFNFIYTAIEAGLSNYIEKNYTPISAAPIHPAPQPSIEQQTQNPDIIQFPTRPKDFYVDEESDTMFVSDSVMKDFEQKTTSFVETTEQKQIFSTQIQEPELKENIIGQYRETYILIDSEEGLEIVDQHIAEERYIYEKLKSEKNIISQMLFVSDVIEISTTESELIKENLDKFERFGYGIEFLKDTEIIFRKVPQLLAKVNPKDIIADILQTIEGDIDNLEEKILITTSCKAAVKANTKLSIWQMEDIIKKWRTTKMPYTCPHGRPISKMIPHKELAGFFQRSK